MMMRWLKSRLKRCLLFASFLSVVFVLSLCLLSAANRAQLRLITPARSQVQAPLVQFYPDNQIRLAAARNRLDGGKKIEDLPQWCKSLQREWNVLRSVTQTMTPRSVSFLFVESSSVTRSVAVTFHVPKLPKTMVCEDSFYFSLCASDASK